MIQNDSICVRFAPSPTGYLHVGGARTALFNYLFARNQGGRFLLRIEDTDIERSEEHLTRQILRSLEWLGIQWDGEPLLQSTRTERHREICHALVETGHAYPCFCSPEALKAEREESSRGKAEYQYNKKCRALTAEEARSRMKSGEPYAIRLKIPSGETTLEDRIRGKVTVQHSEIDDFVILRTSGMPVYQIAVVVDDHDMGITHVIRGDDHLSNTPKQILIYRAMGWPTPVFAHVPMILGRDKKRLSKRHGATSVEEYQANGFLPDTLVNFLALLGWSPGGDKEILSRDEMIRMFSLERIASTPSVFDEIKLEWMNAQYIMAMDGSRLLDAITPILLKSGMGALFIAENREYLIRCVRLMQPRMKRMTEFAEYGKYFFRDPEGYEEKAVQKHWRKDGAGRRTDQLIQALEKAASWEEHALEEAVKALSEKTGAGLGEILQPARIAVTGSAASPGMFELMGVLGKDTVLRRLRAARPHMQE